jgi:hypothetical protein
MAFRITEKKNFDFDRLTVRIWRLTVNGDKTTEKLRLGWIALQEELVGGLEGMAHFLFHINGVYASYSIETNVSDALAVHWERFVEADKSKPLDIMMFHYPSDKKIIDSDPSLCEGTN